MTFVTLFVALLLDRARPIPASSALHGWFGTYAGKLALDLNAGKPVHGLVGWLAAVCPWAALALAVYFLLSAVDPVPAWVWSVIVLYACLGFRNVLQALRDIYAALHVGDVDRARQLLAQWRGVSASDYSETDLAKVAIETGILRAQRELFGVLFWFVVLPGPTGAVLYRLASELEMRWGRRPDEDSLAFGRFSRQAFAVLDWIPARLAAIGFAIAGDFEDAVSSWRSQAQTWFDPDEGIILASGAGAMRVQLGGPLPREIGVDFRPELGEGDLPDAEHLQSTIYLLWRTLIVWLTVLLIFTLAQWVGS